MGFFRHGREEKPEPEESYELPAFYTPWELLQEQARLACNRGECSELRLELAGLSQRYETVGPAEPSAALPELKRLAGEAALPELLPLFESIEELPFGTERRKETGKLLLKLNGEKYEPFFRTVLRETKFSAQLIPPKPASDSVEEILRKNGYSGTWPEYRKRGSFRSMRLFQSYGAARLLLPQKKQELSVRFLPGSVPGKLGMLIGSDFSGCPFEDTFSCAFDCRGNRVFTVRQIMPENSETELQEVLSRAENLKGSGIGAEYLVYTFVMGMLAGLGICFALIVLTTVFRLLRGEIRSFRMLLVAWNRLALGRIQLLCTVFFPIEELFRVTFLAIRNKLLKTPQNAKQ